MATWAVRRRRGKERIDLALQLLWALAGLRLFLFTLGDRGPFLLADVAMTALFLVIMGGAIRRGERFARIALGLLALLSAARTFFTLDDLDGFLLLLGWPSFLANLVLGTLLLDGRAAAFYLREQQLHTRYRRQRQQRPLARA